MGKKTSNFRQKHPLIGNLLYLVHLRIKEITGGKTPGQLKIKVSDFPPVFNMPSADFLFIKSDIHNEYSFNGVYFDFMDFINKKVTRYSVSVPYLSKTIKKCKKEISGHKLPENFSFKGYYNGNKITPHSSHITRDGYILAANTNYIIYIDTNENTCKLLPENYYDRIYSYTDTGGFSPDYKYWYFIRWPFKEYLERKKELTCEIGRIIISEGKIEIIDQIKCRNNIHNITCSPNNKYLVFAIFEQFPNVPYPTVPLHDDIDGYRKSHEAGLNPGYVVTYNLGTKKYWETKVNVPVPGHTEFDPVHENIFYTFSHNFSGTTFDGAEPERVLEGPGAISKMKINENNTEIIKEYSDYDFFRLTQHFVYCKNNKPYIAVSTIPYRVSIVDADEMRTEKRIKIHPYPLPDLSLTGNSVAPRTAPPTINFSSDRRYILLGYAHEYCIYDLEKNDFEDTLFSIGKRGRGHTCDVGF